MVGMRRDELLVVNLALFQLWAAPAQRETQQESKQ